MATNNTTFWKLIESNKISIPIIQRDYAQGREEELEKREKFLNSILSHLESEEKLHLDFVYGREKENVFYPIDGQQRLTTLFLLHWYFVLKENVDTEKKERLSKFVYDTRISSREFCQSLIIEDIKIPVSTNDDSFIKYIKNKHWYRAIWDTDPTIKAMLVMIQAIHNKFHNFDSYDVFERLTSTDLISFELLDLGKKGFELTDELYIKMNARGKQLTSFESFKANFIQFIEKKFKDKKLKHPIKGEISYSGYFSYKIEKEWTDLFWEYRGNKKTIDDVFTNYFEFVTQMFFFKKYKNAKAEDFKNSFAQYEDIYNEQENLLFLIKSLDKLYEIINENGKLDSENISALFTAMSDNSRFFWNPVNENNLFERIILNSKNEDARNKILLFVVLKFMIENKLSAATEELKQIIRVIRNLLQATRQRNETKYNTNIRINNFGSYWMLFRQLLSNDIYTKLQDPTMNNKGSQIRDVSLKNEIEKAKILQSNNNDLCSALIALEEFEEFGGLIHSVKPELSQSKLNDYLKAIQEIWSDSISDTLRIQALIACGFDGLYIKDTKMGETYYFGKSGNWSFVLTNEEEDVTKTILSLLESYINLPLLEPGKKIQTIIDKWLIDNKKDRTYKYYFLKYPEFTSKLNYFVYPNDYEVRMLGTEGPNPLVAYHISPFVFTVCKKLNDKSICDEDQCYLQYSGNSPLILKNGITFESTIDGWKIPNNLLITKATIAKYALKLTDNYYYLKDNDKKDRIEIVIDFIHDILK
ncbi:MAG TPA: DUF262 domain-containing protein [Candidatus Paceibacterota bacterium]|nr:DUF262 domain-containing protein [Candidatus Paceibacterota bacterium]